MKKTDKPTQEQQHRAAAKRKSATELTDHALEKVQGGQGVTPKEA